jgi:hypothetical protein
MRSTEVADVHGSTAPTVPLIAPTVLSVLVAGGAIGRPRIEPGSITSPRMSMLVSRLGS